ncbi:hypothetical protein B7463_g5717, partial [Scytalidium lignicola]
MNDDTTKRSGKPKHRRSAIACKRCNERRVRCDASVHGIPCSNCKKHCDQHCELIQSKKTRGCSGRYIATCSAEPVSTPHGLPLPERACLTPWPEFSLDVRKLLHLGLGDSQVPAAGLSVGTSSPRESWYLSLILELTNNDCDRLPESISTHNTCAHHAPINPTSNRNYHLQRDLGTRVQSEIPEILPSDILSPSLQTLLVDTYFERFHSFCPVISKASFLDQLGQGTVSRLLLRCVLFIGTVHCHMRTIYRMGYDTRREALDEMFRQAQLDFDSGQEKDVLTLLQCSFLLHYWWGQALSFKDPTWWLAGSINAAKAMGLNRKSQAGLASRSRKSLWRRIWWLLYIRDVQVSVSLGRPMSINDHDCDVEELTENDFPDETKDTALYVISQARLSLAVGRQAASDVIQSVISRWSAGLPHGMRYEDRRNTSLVLSLHITERYYQIIFHQKLQRACAYRDAKSRDWEIILNAARDITALAEEIVMYWEPPLFPMICVSAIFVSMTVQYLRLQSTDQIQSNILKRLAGWICSLFTNVVSKLEENYTTSIPNQIGGTSYTDVVPAQPQQQMDQLQIIPPISRTSTEFASPNPSLSPEITLYSPEQDNLNEVFSINGLFDGNILQEISSLLPVHMSHLDFLDLSDTQT